MGWRLCLKAPEGTWWIRSSRRGTWSGLEDMCSMSPCGEARGVPRGGERAVSSALPIRYGLEGVMDERVLGEWGGVGGCESAFFFFPNKLCGKVCSRSYIHLLAGIPVPRDLACGFTELISRLTRGRNASVQNSYTDYCSVRCNYI